MHEPEYFAEFDEMEPARLARLEKEALWVREQERLKEARFAARHGYRLENPLQRNGDWIEKDLLLRLARWRAARKPKPLDKTVMTPDLPPDVAWILVPFIMAFLVVFIVAGWLSGLFRRWLKGKGNGEEGKEDRHDGW